MHLHELFDLSGKTALVTGGSGIFGTPISEALAEAGARVIIASRNLEHCREAANKLVARGLGAAADQYDQASEESILAPGRGIQPSTCWSTIPWRGRCDGMTSRSMPGGNRWRSTPPGCLPSAAPSWST